MGKISGVAYLTSRWVKREPLWLFQSVLMVIGFAILMFVWGGMIGLINVIVAYLVSGVWSMGINLIGQSVGWDKQGKVMDMFIASPIRPYHYILGYYIPSLIFVVVDLLILMPIVLFLNAWEILFGSLIAILPLIVISNMIGLSIVMRIKKPTNISAITNPISTVFIILPPVFYPAQIFPEGVRYIVLLIPTASSAELARQLSGISVWSNLWYPISVLMIWMILGIVLSSKTVKWGME